MYEPFEVLFMEKLPTTVEPYVQGALQYLPYKFRQSFTAKVPVKIDVDLQYQGHAAMEFLYEVAKDQLQMYGSRQELLEQVEEFTDFEGNIAHFSMDPSTHFNHKPRVVNRNHKDHYFSKTDVFTYMQNKLIQKSENMLLRVPINMLAYFLKFHEKKLEGTCEFVLYDYAGFKKLEDEMDQIIEDTLPERSDLESNRDVAFRKLKGLLPSGVKVADMKVTMETMNVMWELWDSPECLSACWYRTCKVMFAGIQKIMKERPHWFLPNAKVDPRLLPSKPIIRLFQDNQSSFVFSKELASALKLTNYNSDESEIVDTVSLETARSICTAHNKQLTFVEIPVRRAKHRAVPIPSGTGTVCILAADVLLENLRDVIFQYGAFETRNEHKNDVLNELIKDFELIFNPEINDIFLFTNSRMKEIELKVASVLMSNEPATQVKNVSAKGFTMEELREETKRLGFDKFFGKVIMDHAEVVFKHVMAIKKVHFLRTCDMYDAIENCVMLCFFEKYQKLAHFLHNQNSCLRIHGHYCSWCDPKTIPIKNHNKEMLKKNFENKAVERKLYETRIVKDEIKTPEVPVVAAKPTLKTEPMAKEVPKPEVPIAPKETVKSAQPSEAPKAPQPLPKPESPKHQKAPKDVTSSEASTQEDSDLKNSNKESKCCSDCLPNSEKCDRANEKLKMSMKRESEMKKEKVSMEKELKEMKRNEPMIMVNLRKDYLRRMKEVEKKLNDVKIRSNKKQEMVEGMERKLAGQEKEIKASKEAKIAEEKIKNNFRGIQEKLSVENENLNKARAEKEKIIEQLQEQLKNMKA